jgi:hypothetical protein
VKTLSVPYQPQLDNESGQGWRECFTSSCAMVAMFHQKVMNDDHYARIRRQYGDTTEAAAHMAALRSLGLHPQWTQQARRATIESELRNGRPVAIGWLHHGPATSPRGGGHWTVAIGADSHGVCMHDPYAEPDMVNGGHIRGTTGRAVWCSWRNFLPRWEVEGPGTGWALLVRA